MTVVRIADATPQLSELLGKYLSEIIKRSKDDGDACGNPFGVRLWCCVVRGDRKECRLGKVRTCTVWEEKLGVFIAIRVRQL